MNDRTMALPRHPLRPIASAGGWILLAAVGLGLAVNTLRPAATHLAWVNDWERHIETQAFRAGIPVVFLPGVRERMEGATTVFLDARSAAAYQAGHLPGAFSVPVEELEQALGDLVAILTPETPLVAYCNDAGCTDGLELAERLKAIGFLQVSLYSGGYEEWAKYGGAISTGDNP